MEWGLFVVTSITYGFISILAWCWLGRRKLPQGTRLLPMPPTSSIIGHQELRHPNFHREKALEWAKEYGPAYRLRMYLRDVVVLNDFESIKKFSAHDEILHRPDIMNFGLDYNKGVLTLNGKAWQDNRRSCLAILRDLGFAKSTTERTLLREYRHLQDKIEKAAGEPVDLSVPLMECAATNVASFFMPRVQSDSRVRAQLMTTLKPVFSFYQRDVLYEFWPPFYEALSRLFPFTSTAKADRIIKDLDNFITTEIVNREDASGKRTFIQEYLNIAAGAGDDRNSSYRQRHLVGNIKMFIIGGIDGPSVSMQLSLVIFAARPTEIQRRIQREIDAVIRQGKLPTWDERKRMPFTVACVWELERWKRTEPFGLPRGTGADMVVDNFFVPKGSVVLFNLWKVNRDPSLWKNPHHFDPGRFLQEDGSLIPEKPSYHVGFSFGRRSCPGESFAIMETFLLITFVLQRYNVELGQQLTCDLDDPAINLEELKSFKLRFTHRSKSANQLKVHPNKG